MRQQDELSQLMPIWMLQSHELMDSFYNSMNGHTPAKRKASALKRRKAKSKRKAKRKSNKRNRR